MTEFKLTKSMSPAPVLEAIEVMCEANPLGVLVTVKRLKAIRTLPQNARYWAMCSALAEYSGDTKNGVHEDALCEHHGEDIIETPRGEKRVPKGRSKKLSREDFAKLSMIVERWMSLAGVPWDEDKAA